MNTNKILISGLTGFVGCNLQAYLSNKEFNDIENLNLRANWEDQIGNNANCIIHLAGKAHDLKKTSNPEEYYKVNYALTRKLYDSFLSSNARTFIFISSVKAAADSVDGILTEDAIPDPQTDYGKSKLMAEEYIQSQALPAGKACYILRPCMIHGPGNKGNLNLLYKFVKKGIPYPLAAFHNKRSFLSIDNLCFVISELLTGTNIPSGVYHIADDEALSTNEVIKLMYKAIGKKALLWPVPVSLIKGMAKAGDVFKLPLNTERLNKLTESYLVDNSKLKTALGKSLPVKSREGITITIKSFQ